jgi:large subunit ribosomal protein L9
MKIILKKDVIGLGYKDEVLTVKDGYGRNYLLPQGFAVLATEKALKSLAEELKQRAHKIAKLKADAEAQAAKFEGVSLTIAAKVSEGKNIYGSVGPKEVVAALAEKGIEVDPKLVSMKAAKFEGVSLTITALGCEGKNIYGSVGPKEIAAALAEKGIEVDSKLISMKAAKALGNYEAVARFHREVSVTIPVAVVSEGGEAVVEAPAAAPAEEVAE